MKLNLPYFDNQVTGIEVVIGNEGGLSYNYVILQKSRSKVEVEESEEGLTELKNLLSLITIKNPVVLSIKGKGIIHKKISSQVSETFESILNKALPNSSIEDFYTQSFQSDAEHSIVSIARKSLIDSILTSFLSKGYKLIGCTLGPFAVQSILPLLQSELQTSYELKFSSHELLIRDGLISNYIPLSSEEAKTNIACGSINVDSSLLVSFSSAFSYFHAIDTIASNILSIELSHNEYKKEVKFKKFGTVALSFFFALLLVNFILFSYLSDVVKSKSGIVLLSSSELSMIDSLSSQLKQRMLFFSKNGLSEPSRTSYYADQIAQNLPTDISLSKIEIQPLRKDNDDDKVLQFDNKKIYVSGKSQYSLDVNEWIKGMRKKEWINTIALLTYNQRETDKPGEFLIEIKVK